MVSYGDKTVATMPVAGTYDVAVPEGDNGRGSLVIRAAYQDRGNDAVPALATEEVIILKSPTIDLGSADKTEGVEASQFRGSGPTTIRAKDNGFIAFENIDMTGIGSMRLIATASKRSGDVGGVLEVRMGSENGRITQYC